MPIGYSSQQNFRKIPVLGLVAENQATASAPASPVKGQLWMDTTVNLLKWWDGTVWQSALGGAIADGDKGDITVSGGGTVWTIDNSAVTSAKIADGTIVDGDISGTAAINGSKLANDTVTATQIAPGAVGNSELGANAVDSSKIQDGTVALADLAANSVDSSKIVDGSVVVGDTATAFDLGALATAHPTTTDVSLNSKKITGLADPSNPNDAASKNYVDLTLQGIDASPSVKAASTVNLTLSALQTVDGVALVAGDRILVKDQSTQAQNGIYVVASGAWARAGDMDAWVEVPGTFCFVEQGTANADTGWLCTSDQGGTLGTTAITWVQFSAAGQVVGGAGLTKTGNTLDVGAGTGITVAADTVSLDTTYTDTRYVNATGPDTMTGKFTVGGGVGNGFIVQDATLPQDTAVFSDRLGWTATDGVSFVGGLGMDNTVGTKKMTLSYPTGTLDVTVPVVTFTGDARAVTPTAGDNDTSVATTAFVGTAITNLNLGQYAPLASPTFTGDPKAPTPTAGDNDTSVATTAFVTAAIAAGPQGTVRKYAAQLPAMSAGVEVALSHGLGTPNVTVMISALSNGAVEEFAVRVTSTEVRVTSDIAYPANTYECVVTG